MSVVATPTPRAASEARMAEAKCRFTEAARAALAGDPDAIELAEAAIAEVRLAHRGQVTPGAGS